MSGFWTHQRKFRHEPVFAGTENCHQEGQRSGADWTGQHG